MNSYGINMKFQTGNNNLREIYCLDGDVLCFYFTRDTAKDFEHCYPQYKNFHCVYILLDNPTPSKVHKVYIGRSDHIKERYDSHKSKADAENWWQVELAFTGRDFKHKGLKEGYEYFLEYYMIYKALQNGQKLPYNSQQPQEPPIDIIEKNNLKNKYFKEINEITKAIGLPIFSNSKSHNHISNSNGTTFHCTSREANAIALYDNNRIVVKQGSKIAPKAYKVFPHQDTLHYLIHNKVIKNNTFTCDYPFSSPTEAGNIVAKSTINGRACWKTKDGKTISDVFDKNN